MGFLQRNGRRLELLVAAECFADVGDFALLGRLSASFRSASLAAAGVAANVGLAVWLGTRGMFGSSIRAIAVFNVRGVGYRGGQRDDDRPDDTRGPGRSA